MQGDYLVDELLTDLAGALPDPRYRRLGDALLGGQQFGCRVPTVATGGGNEMPLFGPDPVGCDAGISQHPDHAVTLEQLGGQFHRLVGGDVECPGHGTDGVSPGERRSEQGDGHGPSLQGCLGVGCCLLVDLPVVERHAVLAEEGLKRCLEVVGSWGTTLLVAESSREVVDGRPGALRLRRQGAQGWPAGPTTRRGAHRRALPSPASDRDCPVRPSRLPSTTSPHVVPSQPRCPPCASKMP